MNQDIDDVIVPNQVQALANEILEEQDPSKAKNLIDNFNWNLSKKSITRAAKLDELYDRVTDQMLTRVRNKPDQFSNDDLLNYMKAVHTAMDNTTKQAANPIEPPQIIQNTQINVNMVDKFDRESRARILAAVQATLKAASASTSETIDYEDKTEGESESNE